MSTVRRPQGSQAERISRHGADLGVLVVVAEDIPSKRQACCEKCDTCVRFRQSNDSSRLKFRTGITRGKFSRADPSLWKTLYSDHNVGIVHCRITLKSHLWRVV